MSLVFQALGDVFASILHFPLFAPPPTDPPTLRIGLGGDIPVAPTQAMALLTAGGWVLSTVVVARGRDEGNEHCGTFLRNLLPPGAPATVYLALRLGLASIVAVAGASLKKACDVALQEVGTGAAFKPVQAVADTGPYAVCRNPMYVAIAAIPGMVGLALDNAYVVVGSNALLLLYIHFVVIPAEERFLEKQVGDEYKKYCTSVKRWGIL